MFIVGVALVNLCSCTKDSPLEIPQVISTIDTLQTSLDPEVNISDCDTSEVSFSTSIVPLISEKCLQCHSGNAPLGGVHLDSYEGVKKVTDSGRLYGALSWQAGYEAMPQGADRLPPCELQNVNAWVNAGALNN